MTTSFALGAALDDAALPLVVFGQEVFEVGHGMPGWPTETLAK
jgi:hypothetical protein